jgi:hypothetical protein
MNCRDFLETNIQIVGLYICMLHMKKKYKYKINNSIGHQLLKPQNPL